MTKKFGAVILKNLYKIAFGLVFVGIFSIIYLLNIGSYIRGDSIYETPKYLSINGVEVILQNIILAPIKVLELVMLKIDEPNSTLLRLVSALFVFISLIVFYRLVLKWQTHRMAILSTFLFGTSSYTIAIGRFTFQEAILLTVFPALLLIGTWLKSKQNVNKLYIAMPAMGVLFYIPGVLTVACIYLIVFRKRIKLALKFSNKKSKIIGASSFGLILSPIVYALVKYPSQIFTYLGVDRLTENGIKAVFERASQIPEELFWSGVNSPEKWLFGTPIIDSVTAVFILLGIYAYFKSEHTLRRLILVGFLASGIIIISMSNFASIALILPVLYLFASNGMAFMLHNWFTVFPRNPAARNLGVLVLLIPVFLSAGYNIERYFTAWHSAPETVQALSKK